MSTIAFQVTSGFGNLTRTKTVTDSHLARLIAAYQVEANTSLNATATNGQVMTYIFERVVADWVAKVKANEAQEAMSAAAAAVTEIVVS